MDNTRVILHSRPGIVGEPRIDNFLVESCQFPPELNDGEVIIRTLYLSVDPMLRCYMNEDTGVDYASPWILGDVIKGSFGVGKVEQSKNESYNDGDVVITSGLGWPWMKFFTWSETMGLDLNKVDQTLIGDRPSLPLSYLGMIGLTAYLGITEKGHVQPDKNQTFVVSGAAGGCGTLAGQIARIKGCSRVVGICGSDQKCAFLKKELNFDETVNYKTECVSERLKDCCPGGIDVYFDNVGGAISDTVIRQMNKDSHVILCGQISSYNQTTVYPPPLSDEISDVLKTNNITRERFLILFYMEKYGEVLQELAKLYMEGKIKVKETIEEGIENVGRAFVSMMNGGNIGKQLVHVSD